MRAGGVCAGLVALALSGGGCPLPTEASHEFRCLSDAQCADNWTCSEGICRKACNPGDGCPQADFRCVDGLCLPPGTGSSSSSSGGSSGLPVSSSGGVSSGSGLSGGSSTSTGSSSGSPRELRMTVVVSGGGGELGGNEYHLQLCTGQPLMTELINNSALTTLTLGVLTTVTP